MHFFWPGSVLVPLNPQDICGRCYGFHFRDEGPSPWRLHCPSHTACKAQSWHLDLSRPASEAHSSPIFSFSSFLPLSWAFFSQIELKKFWVGLLYFCAWKGYFKKNFFSFTALHNFYQKARTWGSRGEWDSLLLSSWSIGAHGKEGRGHSKYGDQVKWRSKWCVGEN